MDNSTAPQSPFAAPAPGAPPQPAPTDAPPSSDLGDTSYLDTVPSTEPLLKPAVVQGVVRTVEIKQSQGGDDYLLISGQLYGDKMLNELNQPVAPGKRFTVRVYPYSKPEKEAVDRKGRDMRDLAFALRNVVKDGKEMSAFASWPPQQRPGVLKPKTLADGSVRVPWSLASFQPLSQWTDTAVMVRVSIRKGDDFNPEPTNEFSLLAKDTKPTERKGR